MKQNEQAGILIESPKDFEARGKVAAQCQEGLHLSLPVVVDGMDNKVGDVYAGWPDRIYIVGRDGKIAYKGEPGPGGFKVAEAQKRLAAVLEAEARKPEGEREKAPPDAAKTPGEAAEKSSDAKDADK